MRLARQTLARQHAAERTLLAAELRALLSAVDSQVAPILAQERSSAADAVNRHYAALLAQLDAHYPPAERAAARDRLLRERNDESARVSRDIQGKSDDVRRRASAAIRDRYKIIRAAVLARQRHERAALAVAASTASIPRHPGARFAMLRASVATAIKRRKTKQSQRNAKPPLH